MKLAFKKRALPIEKESVGTKGIPLTHRMAAKVTAFLLVLLMTALAVVSGVSAAVMLHMELYFIPEEQFRHDIMEDMTNNTAYNLAWRVVVNENKQEAVEYLQYTNFVGAHVHGGGHHWNTGTKASTANTYTETFFWHETRGALSNNIVRYTDDEPEGERIHVTLYMSETMTVRDAFYIVDWLISLAYALRYWVYVIGVAAAITAVVCFVFLMCASGRRPGFDTPHSGWGTRVPLDLLTGGMVLGGFLLVQLVMECFWNAHDVIIIIAYACCALVLLAAFLGWCMSVALRFKLGGWWRNTAVYWGLSMAWRILQLIGRGLRGLVSGVLTLVHSVPLIWKAAVLYLGFSLAEGVFSLVSWGEYDVLMLYLAVKNLILFPTVLFAALMLWRLQKGGEALAQGDLGHQVDTKGMIFGLKRHGEVLNRIGEGMTAAVEQRMRSERMKTELITNVSHDIKTPLTSIINYADLIGKEPSENPTITEYAQVLQRQSERLKRLIEDLVEASKASTGNLEVLLAPCEVDVLLTQTAGEYEQRLIERGLTLVTTQPEGPVRILADGRRLWRVMDNLMNNILKYAQSGTRVYLSLEEKEDKAVITFRNTSREALNIPAEELMERFIQGDAARKAEGNGLGLSIAKSLTELQNGRMELTVDGDLFKVVLTFPVNKDKK